MFIRYRGMRLCLFVVAGAALTATAEADVLVGNFAANSIDAYTNEGALVAAPFINTGSSSGPAGIAVAGSSIYVTNYGLGTVSQYSTSGALLNSKLISGLNGPIGIAVSGSNIYVDSASGIGEYTTSGGVVNASLVGPNASCLCSQFELERGIAVSGSNVFATRLDATRGYVVEEYASDGTVLNPSVVSGLANPSGMTIIGSNLYLVSSVNGGTVGEYTLSGATVNASLVNGPTTGYLFAGVTGLATDGADLYVVDSYAGLVRKYTASGELITENLFTDPNGIAAIAVAPVPLPPAWLSLCLGLGIAAAFVQRRRPSLMSRR